MPNDSRATTQPEQVIAVDVGGTKIAAAVVNRAGRVAEKVRAPTSRASAPAVVDQIVEIARAQLARADGAVAGVGVAVPAVVEPESGFVHWAPNLPDWRDIPLGSLLRETLGVPVYVDYDGHMAALGEHWRGAGRGACNMAFIIIGTGVGGGLVLDGRLYRGSTNLAGASGWMVADPQALVSPEARALGCLESLAAGPGVVAAAERALQKAEGASRLRPPLTTADVFAAADAGDAVAKGVVQKAAQALGFAVTGIVSLLNPDVVILGGGVGSAARIYLEIVRSTVSQYAQPVSARQVRIVTAALGDDAILVGAAHLIFQQVEDSA